MQPFDIISNISSFVENDENCLGAALLGSHARREYGPYSDIDLVVLASDDDSVKNIFDRIIGHLGSAIHHRIDFSNEKKILFIGQKLIRVDLNITSNIESVKSYYVHSEIYYPELSVLVDKRGILKQSFDKWELERVPINIEATAAMEVEKFLDSFETASRYACMGDAFRFYFNFNLCLTRYIRLVNLEEDQSSFLYTPRNFLEGKNSVDRRNVERMAGSFYLSETRSLLEKLATEFRGIYAKLYSRLPELSRSNEEISKFINDIMYRDMIWNLRDVAWVAPSSIKNGKLYRSSTISRFEGTSDYTRLIEELGIKRIIDLRESHEIARYPYSENTRGKIEVVNLFMGHAHLNERIFEPTGKMHIDMIDNAKVIQKFFALLSDGIPTLVHCHSGKDRTGVLIALVLLISGISTKDVKRDFLSSGMNLTEGHADDLFGIIRDHESARSILCQLGVPEENIQTVSNWLNE